MTAKKTQVKLYRIDKVLFPGKAVSEIPAEIIKEANEGITDINKRFKEQPLMKDFDTPVGFTLKVYHALKDGQPGWVKSWTDVLDESATMLSEKNFMSSFIAFVIHGNYVYALTGGLGNFTVNRYIENFFGLDVVDRLLESTQDRGIGEASKSGVTGNVKSESRTFYDLTDGFSQDSFETFFKQIKSKIDKSVAKDYFERFYPRKDYASFFQGGNYFLIRKSISIADIFELIQAVERVFAERETSGHNKLIPIGSVNSTRNDYIKKLNQILLHELFINQENPDVLDGYYFAPKSIPEYQIDGSSFAIEERASLISTIYSEIPKVSEYLETLLNIGGTKSRFTDEKDLKEAIDSYRLFWRHSEETSFNKPLDVFESINGVMEMGNKSYLRFEGVWYEMRDNFKEAINSAFTGLVTNTSKVIDAPPYLSPWTTGNEDDYNMTYLWNNQVLVSHRVMKRDGTPSHMEAYVEYSDLIHLDNTNPKLIHVKQKCNGDMRVAAAQVLMSAQKLNQEDKEEFFREYHGRIMSLASTSGQVGKVSEVDFVRLGLSNNLKICLAISDDRVINDDANLSLCGKFYFVKMFQDLDSLGFGNRFFVVNV